jgi:hypothetical protein
MEVKRTIFILHKLVRIFLCVLLIALPSTIFAQTPVQKYTVKNGRMYIEITKDTHESALDSFIVQFDLKDLFLKEFFKKHMADSLLKRGWTVDVYSETGFIISKPFQPFENINNPIDRIIFTEKELSFAERFPATGNGIAYGHNRFKNKFTFAPGKDSLVTFYLRNNHKASKVMLAGSFNDWNPDVTQMQKTDSGWIARVKLSPGKYWYKFIVDGNWRIDDDNLLRENDGQGNINSIFYNTNTFFYLPGFEKAKNVSIAGSFNKWKPKELMMIKGEGGWYLPLYLSQGTHGYKFVVDGKWMHDERNPNTMNDGAGGLNSFLSLGNPFVFKLKGHQNARSVKLAGSFNDWRDFELEMKKTATGWEFPYVLGPGNYEYKFLVDGVWVADNDNTPATTKGNSILILEPNYTFKLKGFENASRVFIAGDFNNWNPDSFPLQKVGNEWMLPLHLSTGKHLYKFIVDGKWILDPGNKLWEQNREGSGNSIIWIGR